MENLCKQMKHDILYLYAYCNKKKKKTTPTQP